MKAPRLVSLLALPLTALAVQPQEPDLIPELGQPLMKRPGGFHLDLMPKAFAANPRIEMTVYSERTEYGRTLPDVSPEQPAYYVAHSQGYRPMGSSPVRQHPPVQEKIDALMQRVLEKRGFLPAQELAHPPSLALFYYWGDHSGIDAREVMEMPELRSLRQRDVLERARLVGGLANVEKLAQQMAYGIPLNERMAREEHLRYQAEHNLYYVVVSAYDFTLLAHGERRLVWRTTLTVNDQGVSMKETLPPLIASAVDFFGRDTGESLALQRRIDRSSVTLGPLIIIGSVPPDQVSANEK